MKRFQFWVLALWLGIQLVSPLFAQVQFREISHDASLRDKDTSQQIEKKLLTQYRWITADVDKGKLAPVLAFEFHQSDVAIRQEMKSILEENHGTIPRSLYEKMNTEMDALEQKIKFFESKN